MNEETAELMFMFGLQPDVQMQKVAFDSIRSNYLDHIRGLGVKEKIITDKMPHNFFRLGFVLNCFPEAKVIHLNRSCGGKPVVLPEILPGTRHGLHLRYGRSRPLLRDVS